VHQLVIKVLKKIRNWNTIGFKSANRID